jgi:hypothetical protein
MGMSAKQNAQRIVRPRGTPENLQGAGYRAFIDFMCNDCDLEKIDSILEVQGFICGPVASEAPQEG